MKKVKKKIVRFLEYLISLIDPGIAFPEEKMNYKKCVRSILAQTDNGRAAFYSTLFSQMTPGDLGLLRKAYDINPYFYKQPEKPLKHEFTKAKKRPPRTGRARKVQRKDKEGN